MHTFLDNFHQCGKYSPQIASHQAELSIEEKFTDQKSLNISPLQTDYINLDISSGFWKNSERENTVQKNCTFVEVLITLQKYASKRLDRKRKKLARLMLRTTDKRNGHIENDLYVDLKII